MLRLRLFVRPLAFLACLASLFSGRVVSGATSSFDLSACDGLALKAGSLAFLNASQLSAVDVHGASVALSSAPIDPFFGELTSARLTTEAPISCTSQLDALPAQFKCDFYTHSSADTGFAFADGSRGDGVGYWFHPDGDATQPMQMILHPGVYCPSISALNSSYFWVRAITMQAGAIVLDARGDPDAQFVFQSDVLMHFEGTSVSLANNASAANVLWHARNSLSIGVGETDTQTRTVGNYATGRRCGIWMRQTNLHGHLFSDCGIQLEGPSSIHTDAFYNELPPPSDDADSASSFFETGAGIAIIATGSAVGVSAVAAGLWIRAHSLSGQMAASQLTDAVDAVPDSKKTHNKKDKKKKKLEKDKKRLIENVRNSDQAAVSDLLQMPLLAVSRSRTLQVCID